MAGQAVITRHDGTQIMVDVDNAHTLDELTRFRNDWRAGHPGTARLLGHDANGAAREVLTPFGDVLSVDLPEVS
jgi:hypothetical protein